MPGVILEKNHLGFTKNFSKYDKREKKKVDQSHLYSLLFGIYILNSGSKGG